MKKVLSRISRIESKGSICMQLVSCQKLTSPNRTRDSISRTCSSASLTQNSESKPLHPVLHISRILSISLKACHQWRTKTETPGRMGGAGHRCVSMASPNCSGHIRHRLGGSRDFLCLWIWVKSCKISPANRHIPSEKGQNLPASLNQA